MSRRQWLRHAFPHSSVSSLAAVATTTLAYSLLVNRLYIYGVVAMSLIMTWSLVPGIPNWRFGALEDPGITIYLLVVG